MGMFKFSFILLLSWIRFSNGNESGQLNHGIFDIQSILSTTCNTTIEFDSCLMSTFVTLYNTSVGFSDFDFDTCTPPQLLETDLASVFQQSQTICNGKGFNASDDIVQYHINTLLSTFSVNGCLSQACLSSRQNSTFPDLKKVIFETIGSCSGLEIDPNTCLADFSLNQILGGSMSGSEGLRARRILLQATAASSQQTDLEVPSLCEVPIFDAEVINNIVQAGNSICGYEGEDASTLSEALMKMFSSEGCFMNVCKTIEAKGKKLVSSLFESVGKCTGLVIDHNECVISTAIELFLFSPEGGEGGLHARNLMERRLSFQDIALEVLDDVRAICYPPTVDSDIIFQLINGAAAICMEKGEQVDPEGIQNVTEALESIFSADSCWTDFCSDTLDQVQDIVNAPWSLPELAIENVLSCANVQINFDSCVEREMHTEIMNGVTNRNLKLSTNKASSKLRRKRRELVNDNYHNFNRRTEQEENEMCIIPRPELMEKEVYFGPLIYDCNPSLTEMDVAWDKLQIIVQSDTCWETVCGESAATLFLFQSVEKCLNFVVPAIHELQSNPLLLCMLEYTIRFQFDKFHDFDYCPSILGPEAINHCVDVIPEIDGPDNSMSMSYEYVYEELSSYFYDFEEGDKQSYSYSYEQNQELSNEIMKEINEFFNSMEVIKPHSYSYSYSYSYGYEYSYSYEYESGDTYSDLSDKLCFLLEEMKSGKVHDCLSSLLESIQGFHHFDGLKSVTAAPSLEPSPTTMHPSSSDSNVPSSSPSNAPSLSPSLLPSKLPSHAPTTEPSLQPTRIVLAENPNYDDDEASSASLKRVFTLSIFTLAVTFYLF